MSANRGTALNLVWASRVDDTTPHPDARLVLEALGIIAETGREVLPDDGRVNMVADLGGADGNADDANALTSRRALQAAESSRDRSHVPAGLRTLAPPAPAPVKPRRPVEGVREPKPAKAPRAPQPRKPTPAPVAAVPKPRKSSVTAEKKPRKRARCGTPSGYARHRREGQDACDVCKRAAAAAQRERAHRNGTKPFEAAACGTYTGFKRHVRAGEEPCEPCQDARRAYQRERYHARQGRTFTEPAPDQVQIQAWQHALARDLDEWLAAAQRSPQRTVRAKAAVAVAALLALRIAMDDLARAERQRDGKAAS